MILNLAMYDEIRHQKHKQHILNCTSSKLTFVHQRTLLRKMKRQTTKEV